MKKFSFSLDTVHKFKGQILDSLLNELAVITATVVKKQNEIKLKEMQLAEFNDEFNEKSRSGISINEITNYKVYIKRLQREIEAEYKKLEELYKQQAEKQAEVIESKKENLSIDKLKEKKLIEYNAMVQKDEELIVEEFVTNSLISNR